MIEVNESFEVEAPPESVYDSLNDVAEIGYSVSGVKIVEVMSDGESRWTIEQRVGFIARTFTLSARITTAERPAMLAFVATGDDVNVTGRVELERTHAEGTRCALMMNVDVEGALAPLVELFAKNQQRQLIEETIKNLEAKLQDGYTAPRGGSQPAPRRRSWWDRLRARLGRIRARHGRDTP